MVEMRLRERSHSTAAMRVNLNARRWLAAFVLACLSILCLPHVSLQAASATPQEQAIARLNELRAYAHAPPVRADPALQQAAEAHAAYYAENGFTGHYQEPTSAGFTGATPADRIKAAGFTGKCTGESASTIGGDPAAAVDALVNSVYHRTIMLHPALVLVGYGQSAGGSVFDFGGCVDGLPVLDRLYIYPGVGQSDVPHSFLPRTEIPNPLPDTEGYVGSPISIGASPWSQEPVHITDARIVDQAGVPLSFHRVDDDGWTYFMTTLPLGAGQTITVSITGNAVASEVGPFARTWSFSTQSAFLPHMLHLRFVQGTPQLVTEYVAKDYACYGQTTGQTSTLADEVVTLPCYDIVNGSEAYGEVPFLAEFRRAGGVDALGYPLTRAITYEGRPTQFFQKGVLQWQSATRSFAYLNVFDMLSTQGFDPVLATQYLIPPPADTSAADGLNWDQVAARRMAIMYEAPAIATYVLNTPNWLDRYGLPTGSHDYGNVVVVRAQRAAFQWWRVDTPFAKAGEVTVVNSGDIAKALGAFVR